MVTSILRHLNISNNQHAEYELPVAEAKDSLFCAPAASRPSKTCMILYANMRSALASQVRASLSVATAETEAPKHHRLTDAHMHDSEMHTLTLALLCNERPN